MAAPASASGRERGLTPPLTLDDTVAATPDQVSADLTGEVVILGMRDGVYYGADNVGARIWALVQQPMRLAAVVETLVAEFNVDTTQCAADVLVFVGSLVAKGLVARVATEPTA